MGVVALVFSLIGLAIVLAGVATERDEVTLFGTAWSVLAFFFALAVLVS